MIKKLLSLPTNVVDCFHELREVDTDEWFCAADPPDMKLGSGGGTIWLLEKAHNYYAPQRPFTSWLAEEKRILIHAGGEGRRIPAYASSGKSLIPLPVHGQSTESGLHGDLLSLQVPICERIMRQAPEGINTLVACGDVCVRMEQPLPLIPYADVICIGMSATPAEASTHGMFVFRQEDSDEFDMMIQKPSEDTLRKLAEKHGCLIDSGIWLLSDRAVMLLAERSKKSFYDLYSDFGSALGNTPTVVDDELNELSVHITHLDGGTFYHFGTSGQLVSLTLALQNVAEEGSVIVQNSDVQIPLTSDNTAVWIENSHVGPQWELSRDHVITGVPRNYWSIHLPPQVCVDVIPVAKMSYIARPYGCNDVFKGDPNDESTIFMGKSFLHWMNERRLTIGMIGMAGIRDIQFAELFPECDGIDELGVVLRWMVSEPELSEGRKIWITNLKFSARQIQSRANLKRLFSQRKTYCLNQASGSGIEFESLQKSIVAPLFWRKQYAVRGVESGQIVFGRCHARIDLAGGWTDTLPYCIDNGGSVVNMAVALEGQPPVQVYVKYSDRHVITLRSVNSKAEEVISTYGELENYTHIGSSLSIPKAALTIAGFSGRFSQQEYNSLAEHLEALGGGIEIGMMSAVPIGSGLGVSSILAATILRALSDFCRLGWTHEEVCGKVFALEQMLTTGGGWQDQFGGTLPGVKLLKTARGLEQRPIVTQLNDTLFTNPDYASCQLLYYTGISRSAKGILSKIVRRMFLKQPAQLSLLAEIKNHALDMCDAIQHEDFERFGTLLGKSWRQNKMLDKGVNHPEVEQITHMVSDYTMGCKLSGAGGGGYLYMVAKDAEAAIRIKRELTTRPPNSNAKFVDMSIGTQLVYT